MTISRRTQHSFNLRATSNEKRRSCGWRVRRADRRNPRCLFQGRQLTLFSSWQSVCHDRLSPCLHALTTSAQAAYIALHTDRLYMPKHPRCSPRNGNQTYWTIAAIALLLAAGCSSNDKSQNNENSALNLYV